MNRPAAVEVGTPLFPQPARRHRAFGGLTERQEHIFTWISVAVVLFYVAGWVGAFDHARRLHRQLARDAADSSVPAPAAATPTAQIASSMLSPNAPTTAYISDAMLGFVDPLRGASGKVRVALATPGQTVGAGPSGGASAVLTDGRTTDVSPQFEAPANPGIYKLAVEVDRARREISDFSIITMVPFRKKERGRIGQYLLGSWPYERGGRPRTPAYADPKGFIEVTPQNADTWVSEHFRLRDFLTKGQTNVWPKYVLLNAKLLDKLELMIAELESNGHDVRHVQVMSGFRTPEYNTSGGNTAGRANLSRHMYGDASDVFVDNDRNGVLDDLNGDGRVDTRDAEVMLQALERVEREHPELVGGVGVYSACCGHGPFTHVDVRGFRARWRGSSGG